MALTGEWVRCTAGNTSTSLEKHYCSKPSLLKFRRVTSNINRRHHRVPEDFCTETSAQAKLGFMTQTTPRKMNLGVRQILSEVEFTKTKTV